MTITLRSVASITFVHLHFFVIFGVLRFHRNLALHDHHTQIRSIDHLIWFRAECFIAITC